MNSERKPWDEEAFLAERAAVLEAWPTGREVDLAETVAFHRLLPVAKSFPAQLARGQKEGRTLTQPRAGVALVHEHIQLLRYLEEEGEADLLPTTIDSYTRQNRYREAQQGMEESRKAGRSLLNGFPAVNQGLARCRQVIEQVGRPVQVRHGTPDARLLAEITLAAGFTAFEGGGISYNIPYAKDVPLEKSLRDWRYVDRLVGWYQEQGITINREPFGPLTGTLVPPSISHAIAIIEALLAAEQGVGNLTVGYGQGGNLLQDVGALQTLKELTREYLDRFGYRETELSTVFHQWMGGFPQDESKAFGVIAWGAVAAALGQATKVIVKTPHEALGVPTQEANAAGLRCTKQIINMVKDQPLGNLEGLAEEKEMIRAETRAILEKVLELGEGDVAQGVLRAFQAGVLDVPFAPSRITAGRLLPVRDAQGAIRLLDGGNLPFDQRIREFHREKLAERGRKEGRTPSFQMVIDDIYAIGKGMLVGKKKG